MATIVVVIGHCYGYYYAVRAPIPSPEACKGSMRAKPQAKATTDPRPYVNPKS